MAENGQRKLPFDLHQYTTQHYRYAYRLASEGITMKRFIFSVVAAFLVAANVYAIGPTYSGSWYNPAQSGHGFSLEYTVLKDGTPVVVAYWYVYDSEGNPIFLIGNGEPGQGNTVTLEFEAPYGMKFGEFDPESTIRADGGTGVFTFEDSEAGVFDYEPSQWMKDTYGVSAVSLPVVQLLEVAHPNDEPPPNEPPPTGDPVPVPGSWSGRMVYDRGSTGTCHDADVSIYVTPYHEQFHKLDSLIVIRDSGGLDNVGFIGNLPTASNSASGDFGMFYSEVRTFTNYTIQFNTQGSAEGYWNYENGDCYGDWSFTKDYEPPPTGDPVPVSGSWSGRMVYDRRSTGTCHDADVSIYVTPDLERLLYLDILLVILNKGGGVKV
jgi:hypothetical protein